MSPVILADDKTVFYLVNEWTDFLLYDIPDNGNLISAILLFFVKPGETISPSFEENLPHCTKAIFQ